MAWRGSSICKPLCECSQMHEFNSKQRAAVAQVSEQQLCPVGWKLGSPATAYVCQDFTCKAPTTDPKKLKASLESSQQTGGKKPLAQPIDLSSLSAKATEGYL